MLFNTYLFIFVFLPVVFVLFFTLSRIKIYYGTLVLLVSSLFFYSWWSLVFLGLLLCSAFFNYYTSVLILHYRNNFPSFAKSILIFSLITNISLLCYFKYTNFFIVNLNYLFNFNFNFKNIILPLGISFFTFTQIAFLVDAYKSQAKQYTLSHYLLFVTYFPHLIAGPILHHKDVIPQFDSKSTYIIDAKNCALGITIFIIGLFKKVFIADNVAQFVEPVFNSAESFTLSFFEAWGGALAYSMQIYFDFSGYCDMAIGISLLFNIKLPMNFYSPYTVTNIIDFWRQWHMTLSRFLRDYLYIPLGGSYKGNKRRYFNLIITMLLGGLWHGSNWTFVIWGGLHGIYLVINHFWRSCKSHYHLYLPKHLQSFAIIISWLFTFVAATVAWVFFRAKNVPQAICLIKSMFGFYKIFPAANVWLFPPNRLLLWLGLLFVIILFLPNSKIISDSSSSQNLNSNKTTIFKLKNFYWTPNFFWILITASLGFISLLFLNNVSYFLYFQF